MLYCILFERQPLLLRYSSSTMKLLSLLFFSLNLPDSIQRFCYSLTQQVVCLYYCFQFAIRNIVFVWSNNAFSKEKKSFTIFFSFTMSSNLQLMLFHSLYWNMREVRPLLLCLHELKTWGRVLVLNWKTMLPTLRQKKRGGRSEDG